MISNQVYSGLEHSNQVPKIRPITFGKNLAMNT